MHSEGWTYPARPSELLAGLEGSRTHVWEWQDRASGQSQCWSPQSRKKGQENMSALSTVTGHHWKGFILRRVFHNVLVCFALAHYAIVLQVFVPIDKPIIRLTYEYCKYLLNVRGLGDIYCTCSWRYDWCLHSEGTATQAFRILCRKQQLPCACVGVTSLRLRPVTQPESVNPEGSDLQQWQCIAGMLCFQTSFT